MSGTFPPPSVEEDPWYKWSKTINDRAEKQAKRLHNIEKVIFGTQGNKEDEAEPPLLRLIRNLCWEIMLDKGAMRYTGTWDAKKLYGPGACVTDKGAFWVALSDNEGIRPGKGDPWKLALKSDVSLVTRIVADEVARQFQERGL